MNAEAFVAELIRENDQLLARLAPAATLTNEVAGDLAPVKLLRAALKNEIEASEIAARWLPTAGSVSLKLALARQAGDEAKHYALIETRLRELDDNLIGFNPLATGYSPMFQYLASLGSDVERVAAQFTREAIAVVKNRQFIELCERAGDAATARLYRDVIEPDERFHHEMGVKFLRELATDAEAQALARAARLRTIEVAEELQNLAFARAKIHHAPGC